LPNPPAVSIVATSVADVTKSGNSTANVTAHQVNQDLQNPPIKLGTGGGNSTDKTTGTQNGQPIISCCSGTLGSLISRGGNQYILSNNHVLDKSNQGAAGDPISQPGLADAKCGQNPTVTVAHLSQSVHLPTDGTTGTVDAAMAQVVSGEVDTSGTILDLAGTGQPAPPSATIITSPSPGQGLAKSGDATGLTCSTIFAINTRVQVDYANSCGSTTTFRVVFDNQVIVNGGTFSNNGDSGSLIVASDTSRPIALLYAGSSSNTAGNPIQDVLTGLKDPSSGEVPQMVGGSDHPVACPAAGQAQTSTQQRELTTGRLSDSEISRATAAKDRHSVALMQDPAVTGVGVGQSEDNPAESAIVVFLKDQPRFPIPAQIDGVRTKLVAGSDFRAEQAGMQRRSLALPSISKAEVDRVHSVKQQHAAELMKNPAILGVGVGASNDNPGEGAVIVFVEEGKSVAVPSEIDGARTHVVTTDPLRTFDWGSRTHNSCSTSRACSSCKPLTRDQ
jgi:hypothetical protein